MEGTGTFDFNPAAGPPWNGYIKECSYCFDSGRQGPFRCDGQNPGFTANVVRTLSRKGCFVWAENDWYEAEFNKCLQKWPGMVFEKFACW
jgi:hypothetical protein